VDGLSGIKTAGLVQRVWVERCCSAGERAEQTPTLQRGAPWHFALTMALSSNSTPPSPGPPIATCSIYALAYSLGRLRMR
jgi:hypothetical protein